MNDSEVIIEQVDSDEEVAKPVEITAKKQKQAILDVLKQCILDYLKHIGEEDAIFLSEDMCNVARTFEQWSYSHSTMTECHSVWLRTCNIFIGSSHAYDLCRNPLNVLRGYAPFNIAAGFAPCQPKIGNAALRTEAIKMGIVMEEVVRKSHVRALSKPLKTAKPGRVVATHGPIGMSCTGDIELRDENGEIAALMEVKTLYKARVPYGLSIPDTAKKAKMCTREILSKHNEFSLITKGRFNIFRQKSRFVDLKMLKQYGASNGKAQWNKYAVHSHIAPALLLDCCVPYKEERVSLYFYKSGDTTGQPARTFSMLKTDLGLSINPWSATAWQMLMQCCVYRTCPFKNFSNEQMFHNARMHLLLVVPYNTDVEVKPEPYLIMRMPVYFPDRLCQQFESFCVASVCEYVSPPPQIAFRRSTTKQREERKRCAGYS